MIINRVAISKRTFVRSIVVLLSAGLPLMGCAPGQNGLGGFDKFGAEILGSTGVVSGSQANAIFGAGSKLIKAAETLSPEQEYYLGRSVSGLVLSRYKPHTRSGLNAYLSRVGSVLVAASPKPEVFNGYRFQVLDSAELNAISAPSGFVFVTRGLLNMMPDEDALAAVLAHEIAHVQLGHGTKAISRSNLTGALSIIGKEAASNYAAGTPATELVGVFGDSVTEVFDTLVTNGYSRSQEYEADIYAAAILDKAGYGSASLKNMLGALASKEDSSKGGWFDTHPTPKRRISNLEDDLKLAVGEQKMQPARSRRFKAAIG